MSENKVELPPIPAQRYFTEAEVCLLAGITAASLHAWAAEQTDLLGDATNRFYLRHHVLLLRRLRDKLFDDGFSVRRVNSGGEKSITAQEVRGELGSILHELHVGIGKS